MQTKPFVMLLQNYYITKYVILQTKNKERNRYGVRPSWICAVTILFLISVL